MIKVGIIGGTGYTGVELLRILSHHPQVSLQAITSRSEAGKNVSTLFPSLRGITDLQYSDPDQSNLSHCDVVFFATPNGIAMTHAPALLDAGVKIIDLGADFRIKNAELWEQWYGMQHACPDLLSKTVYGLPELYRSDIKNAHLVANPGCYPTAIILAALPLLESGLLVSEHIIADAKSGVSGAGRGAKVANLFGEVADNFRAYGVTGHRHDPEITQVFQHVSAKPVDLTFVPHLVPMIRGIHATVYFQAQAEQADLTQLFHERYKDESFVDILDSGNFPETRSVKGSNQCHISVNALGNNKIVVLSVIDNLVKGAAGQAVQNMNIMFGLEETSGLTNLALTP